MADSADAQPGGSYDPGDLWTDLKIGLIFYTRLPIRLQGAFGPAALARATRLNPVVGAIVGFIGALAYGISSWLAIPPLIAALIAIAATILVTGALHEDGLADFADGLGGGAGAEHKLQIMADSRLGTCGVLALILSVAIRAIALATINDIDVAAVAFALILAHAAGRAIIPPLMAHLPQARPSGLAASVGTPPANSIVWSLLGALVIAILAVGPVIGLTSLIAAAIGSAIIAFIALRKLGGMTGDVLGAVEQVVEITILVVIATFVGSAHGTLAA